MARLPRNQLLDLLFQLFREQPRWSFKPLRERTQQPEVYLKEVLNEIATLHRSGEYNGMWELSEIFAREGVSVDTSFRYSSAELLGYSRSKRKMCLARAPGRTAMWRWKTTTTKKTMTMTWRRFRSFAIALNCS